ncbi:hypothetical protein SBBP2_570051 [Burkholderiales bacterium]|nr:hypothetical protein SBBP2_570051 [Burkholderiales bacterium]
MMCRRKRIWIVETACRDIDELRRVGVRVCQRSSAACAERSSHGCRGRVFRDLTLHETEALNRERDPSNNGRRCRAPAGPAMADHAVDRGTLYAVPNRSAQTTTINVRQCHFVSPRGASSFIPAPSPTN